MLLRRLALPLGCVLLVTSCSGSDDGSDVTSEPVTSAGSTADPTAEPGGDTGGDASPDATELLDVSIEASPYIGLAAVVSAEADMPVRLEVTARSGDHVVEVPRTASLTEAHDIPLVGMRPERLYDIEVEAFTDDGESLGVARGEAFETSALPVWFADHELTIDPARAAPGFTIVEFDTLFIPEGASSSQHLVAYDNDGEVVWYYTNTGALGGVEQTPAGTFNMFYWPFGIREVDIVGNVINNWRPQPAAAEGSEVDDSFILETGDPEQIDFQGGVGALAGNPGDAEPVAIRADWIDLNTVHHESWPMPNGNVLTMSTTIHELTPEQRATFCPGDPAAFNAISDVIVEFEPSGRVLRTWDLWDAVDIDEFPGREMCVDAGIFQEADARDWTHANSAIYDPVRDAIVVSSRHTDQIIAFDHLDDEGPQAAVRWILGAGATMPFDGDLTHYQHAVEVNDDGSFVIYDNGNHRPGTSPDDPDNPTYSRAVIYEVDDSSEDPADWSARQRWEYRPVGDDGTPVYTEFIGDADVLSNGNVLVHNGGIGTFPPSPDDPLHILIQEVVPEGDSGGEVVWELRSAPQPPHVAYRSERIESFYVGDDWIPRG